MVYVSIESISKRFHDKYLFQDLSLGIGQGEKLALVGINGSGKTTLLKIIAGKETPDSGQVVIKNNIKVAYAAQNPDYREGDSVTSFIFASDNPTLQVIRDYDYYIQHAGDDEASQEKLQELIQQMDELNAWDYESQIQQILGKLGIYNMDRPMDKLSGGQRKRVALAKVLIERPDFLILDEPTNHLDLETIEWMENYLAAQNMSLILVTHDRYFLEKVTNQILELENGKLYRYKGNYSYFLGKKEERKSQEQAEVDKARNLLRKELAWMKTQPKARGTKAKARLDNVDELQEKATQEKETGPMNLNFRSKRQGKKILEAEHLTKSFDGTKIIDDFTYTFKPKDRIGIIGKNGSGKSTLINMLVGQLPPDEGYIETGTTTHFGYYTQEEPNFNPDKPILEVVKEVAEVIEMGDGKTITAKQLLQHFQFSTKMHFTKVGVLSGGERRRLQLLRVLIKNPNFLILDEPTNDLDILTLNILEDFLYHFDGCLIVVTHDRYFMDRLVDHLFILENEHGKVKDFPGNYTDYRTSREEQEQEKQALKKKPSKNPPKPSNKTNQEKEKTKPSYKEQKEYETLEQEIEQLEQEKQTLEAQLNQESPGDSSDINKISEDLASINKKLEEKSNRWLELAELMG